MQNEEKASVSFPSLLSHMTSAFLNHPVIPMTTYADSGVPEMLNTFSPLVSSMPCDMHIVNLRTIQSKVRSYYYFYEQTYHVAYYIA